MKMKMTKMVIIGSSDNNNNNDDDGDSGVSVMMSVGKHDYLSQTNKVVDGESCIGSVDRDSLSFFLCFSLSFSVCFTFFPSDYDERIGPCARQPITGISPGIHHVSLRASSR